MAAKVKKVCGVCGVFVLALASIVYVCFVVTLASCYVEDRSKIRVRSAKILGYFWDLLRDKVVFVNFFVSVKYLRATVKSQSMGPPAINKISGLSCPS